MVVIFVLSNHYENGPLNTSYYKTKLNESNIDVFLIKRITPRELLMVENVAKQVEQQAT